MKKISVYLLLVFIIIAFATPLATLADTPNVTVIGSRSETVAVVGGSLPGYHTAMLNNSGLIYDLMLPQDATEVSIERNKTNGNDVSVTLKTSGPAYATKIGDVFFAIYDENGKLTYLSMPKNAVVGEYTYSWTGVDLSSGTKISVFVWNLSTFEPLCESRINSFAGNIVIKGTGGDSN